MTIIEFNDILCFTFMFDKTQLVEVFRSEGVETTCISIAQEYLDTSFERYENFRKENLLIDIESMHELSSLNYAAVLAAEKDFYVVYSLLSVELYRLGSKYQEGSTFDLFRAILTHLEAKSLGYTTEQLTTAM